MYTSPRHIAFGAPDDWSLDDKIEVFIASVDGWHLEVADRCINGWQVDGQECIRTIDLHGNPTKHIPDAGWASLQIVLNYFEVIAYYKLGFAINEKSGQRFMAGVRDVFPHLNNYSVNVPELLWKHLRNGLYHIGVTKKIKLRHREPLTDIYYDEALKIVVIDPHVFIRSLRQHFRAYAERLRDVREVDLRKQFETSFDEYRKLYDEP